MYGQANLTLQWKHQMPMYDDHFSNFGRPPISMIRAKIRPQDLLGSEEEDFLSFLSNMGMAAILVNKPRPF